MKWIKCSERLPNNDRQILVVNSTRAGDEIWTAFYGQDYDNDDSEIKFYPCPIVGYGERCPFPFEEITHWSEMPFLPGKESSYSDKATKDKCESPCQLCAARHKSNHEVKK